MRLRVKNNQRYIIGRGGYGFPPNQTVDVTVNSQPAYRQIKACRYLEVTVLEDAGPDADADADAVARFEAMTVAELEEYADANDIELPKNAKKAELVEYLAQASATNGDGDETDA